MLAGRIMFPLAPCTSLLSLLQPPTHLWNHCTASQTVLSQSPFGLCPTHSLWSARAISKASLKAPGTPERLRINMKYGARGHP